MKHLAILAALLAFSLLAQAETVMVKYVGPVDLSEMRCGATESSLVHRICYRRSEQRAVVLLGNTYYQFCRISPPLMGAWINAQSLGQFFNARIKGRHDC